MMVDREKLTRLATITRRVRDEHVTIEGNACASDDPDADRALCALIRAELRDGNEYAWCSLIVVVKYRGLTGRASLGCVSVLREYADGPLERNPALVEMWTDLEGEAIEDLALQIEYDVDPETGEEVES